MIVICGDVYSIVTVSTKFHSIYDTNDYEIIMVMTSGMLMCLAFAEEKSNSAGFWTS